MLIFLPKKKSWQLHTAQKKKGGNKCAVLCSNNCVQVSRKRDEDTTTSSGTVPIDREDGNHHVANTSGRFVPFTHEAELGAGAGRHAPVPVLPREAGTGTGTGRLGEVASCPLALPAEDETAPLATSSCLPTAPPHLPLPASQSAAGAGLPASSSGHREWLMPDDVTSLSLSHVHAHAHVVGDLSHRATISPSFCVT